MRKSTICGAAAIITFAGAGLLATPAAGAEPLPPCPLRLVTEIQTVIDQHCVDEGAHHAQLTSLDCQDGVANFTWECIWQ
jgi:hypothetical protein